MKQNRVEPVRPAADWSLADNRGGRDLARAALQMDEVALAAFGHGTAWRRKQIVDCRVQVVDSAAAYRDGSHHGNAELAFEHFGVELEPVAPREIDHVQGDDRRQPELDQLQREAQDWEQMTAILARFLTPGAEPL